MTVIEFSNASHRRRALRRTGGCNGSNMHTFLFRSLKMILESDGADLARDVRLDIHKAEIKLKGIRRRLASLQRQAAAQVQQLTSAEIKLTAAIASAQASPAVGEKEGAYRDLLEAFGKLDRHGQECVVHYLSTQV